MPYNVSIQVTDEDDRLTVCKNKDEIIQTLVDHIRNAIGDDVEIPELKYLV